MKTRAHFFNSLPDCSQFDEEFIAFLLIDASVEDVKSEEPHLRFELASLPLELPTRLPELLEGGKLSGCEVCGS